MYDGYFSVQLSQSTIDVKVTLKKVFICSELTCHFIKTEIRQHTVLASVALAGGCYGVLTTIYILLFGMTRLTPWGLVHHVPVFFSKRRHQEFNHYPDNEAHTIDSNKKKTSILIPWFFRSRVRGSDKTYTPTDAKEAIMTKMIVRSKLEEQGNLSRIETSELQLLNCNRKSPITPLTSTPNNLLYLAPQIPSNSAMPPPLLPRHSTGNSSSSDEVTSIPMNDTYYQQTNDERTIELMNRVEELEIILSEYFINTDYLDELRSRRNALSPAGETLKHLEERNNY